MIKPYKLVERYLEEIKAAIQQDDYDLSHGTEIVSWHPDDGYWFIEMK